MSGACFIVAGAALVAGRHATPAAFSIAVLVFAWAVTRNLPLALADASFGGPWTRLGKAVALQRWGAGRRSRRTSGRSTTHRTRWDSVGRCALGVFLINSGVQHFLFTGAVHTLIPTWIPGPRLWAYVTGVALIAGGAGLIVPRTTRIAGLSVGLMLFTWVCILHIPRAFLAAPANQRNEWTAVFEALAFAGLALVAARRPRAR